MGTFGALLSLISIDPGAGRCTGVNLARPVDLALRIVVHLFPVGNPSGQASDGKHHREHVGGNAHGTVQDSGIEVHVGVELTGYKVERTGRPGSADQNTKLVKDTLAPPMWARFYDLELCEPFVCDRDGVPRRHLEQIGV